MWIWLIVIKILLQVFYHHDDVINWKHFPRNWPFVRGIHRSQVNSSHTGRRCGALMFSLICAWTKGKMNNRDADNLRCHRAYYDVTVVTTFQKRANIRYRGEWKQIYLHIGNKVVGNLLGKEWPMAIIYIKPSVRLLYFLSRHDTTHVLPGTDSHDIYCTRSAVRFLEISSVILNGVIQYPKFIRDGCLPLKENMFIFPVNTVPGDDLTLLGAWF